MKNEISIKAAVYLRAAELVEMGHCKGVAARNAEGQGVECYGNDAISFCYIGALARASFEIDNDMTGAMACAPVGTVSWNDDPERTPAEVAALLRERAFS